MVNPFYLVAAVWLMASGGPESRPVDLVVEPVDGAVTLTVVGESLMPLDVRYALEVTGGKGNHSVQRGTSRLLPGRSSRLIRIRVSASQEGWSAKLHVTGDNSLDYVITRQG